MAGKPGRPRKERAESEDDSDKIWGVRGVDEATRKRIKVYALEHDLSVGQALVQLVEKGIRYDRLPRHEQVRPVESDDEIAARLLGDLQRAYNRQKQQQPQPAPNETEE